MTAVADRFAGKVAVVTGAASGIGAAIARRLVAEGARVVGGDIDEAALAAVGDELGERFVGVRCDVTVATDVEAMVAAATDDLGGLDVAFNVAGASRPGLIVDLSEEDWDFTVDLCLKGTFLCLRQEARAMIAGGTAGAIVNIASLNSTVPMFFGAAYSSAKAGVAMLGQSGALELADHGIRVNTVSPGLTDTPLVKGAVEVPAVLAAYLERIPLGRPATPEDIAATGTYLASDDAAYVSGVNVAVDGAWAQSGYPDLRPHLAATLDPSTSR
ncbi:MAG: SDR family NAD(P)-dependent oxidoreductase [Actinomycetota bacterium]|nr:SDR family NAD(P)-dependent oxidoreductase [Actinomycetota bacterium]